MTSSTSSSSPLRSHKRSLTAVAAIVAAAATAVFAFTLDAPDRRDAAKPESPAVITESATPEGADESLLALARRDGGDALAVGKVDAPVVMIEYSDFQCPFCGRFARETEPALLRSYVDKGVLRIEWRNFPVFGAEEVLGLSQGRLRRAAGTESGRVLPGQAGVHGTSGGDRRP